MFNVEKLLFLASFGIVFVSALEDPCEPYLRYFKDDNPFDRFAVIALRRPSSERNYDLWVDLAQGSKVKENNGGGLSFIEEAENGKLFFRLNYPDINGPVIDVLSIKLNGKTICEEPKYVSFKQTTKDWTFQFSTKGHYTTKEVHPTAQYTSKEALGNQKKKDPGNSGQDQIRFTNSPSGSYATSGTTKKPYLPPVAPAITPDDGDTTIRFRPGGSGNSVYYVPPSPKPVTTTKAPEPEEDFNQCGVQSHTLVRSEKTTKRGEYPWLSILYLQEVSDLIFRCAGSLVNERYIVTAGHCVHNEEANKVMSASLFRVIMGRHNLKSWSERGERNEAVSRVFLHPQYTRRSSSAVYADIAVLRLAVPVKFTLYIRPICLDTAESSLESVIGQIGTVVGWSNGINWKGQADIQTEPKQSSFPIVSNDKCKEEEETLSLFINNKTFCAGSLNGEGPCLGDSGSGFYLFKNHRWYLRGVVSIALEDEDKNCDFYAYFVFTDVGQVLNWIRNIIS